MDCLVTKLKGTVNDSSLLPLGGMFLKVVEDVDASNDDRKLCITSLKAQVISVVGGANNLFTTSDFSQGGANSVQLNINEEKVLYCKDGSYNILVPDKYSLVRIGSWNYPLKTVGLNLEDLAYSKGLKVINSIPVGGNIEGDIAALAGLPLRFCNIGDCVRGDIKVINEINWSTETNIGGGMPASFIVYSKNKEITGKISELNVNTTLTQLGFNSQTGISGSLAEITAKLPNLTHLDIPHTNITGDIKDITCPLVRMGVYDCTGISGSLEQFVATQRIKGRTTGTCSNAGHWTGNITLDGSPLTDTDEGSFSWTATQITCGEKVVTA